MTTQNFLVKDQLHTQATTSTLPKPSLIVDIIKSAWKKGKNFTEKLFRLTQIFSPENHPSNTNQISKSQITQQIKNESITSSQINEQKQQQERDQIARKYRFERMKEILPRKPLQLTEAEEKAHEEFEKKKYWLKNANKKEVLIMTVPHNRGYVRVQEFAKRMQKLHDQKMFRNSLKISRKDLNLDQEVVPCINTNGKSFFEFFKNKGQTQSDKLAHQDKSNKYSSVDQHEKKSIVNGQLFQSSEQNMKEDKLISSNILNEINQSDVDSIQSDNVFIKQENQISCQSNVEQSKLQRIDEPDIQTQSNQQKLNPFITPFFQNNPNQSHLAEIPTQMNTSKIVEGMRNKLFGNQQTLSSVNSFNNFNQPDISFNLSNKNPFLANRAINLIQNLQDKTIQPQRKPQHQVLSIQSIHQIPSGYPIQSTLPNFVQNSRTNNFHSPQYASINIFNSNQPDNANNSTNSFPSPVNPFISQHRSSDVSLFSPFKRAQNNIFSNPQPNMFQNSSTNGMNHRVIPNIIENEQHKKLLDSLIQPQRSKNCLNGGQSLGLESIFVRNGDDDREQDWQRRTSRKSRNYCSSKRKEKKEQRIRG